MFQRFSMKTFNSANNDSGKRQNDNCQTYGNNAHLHFSRVYYSEDANADDNNIHFQYLTKNCSYKTKNTDPERLNYS